MKRPFSSTLRILALLGVCLVLWIGIVLYKYLFLFPHIPTLTGFPFSEKTYLVLLQNDAELRPTGGFISAVGEMRFRSGVPAGIEIKDVFALDEEPTMVYKTPPYPLGEFLKNEFYKGHSFRDANWSPDFPTSAQELIGFYEEIYPQKHIDGVIAVNFRMIEKLFALYSPLKVGEYTLTEKNLFSTLQYEQNNIDRHNKESLQNRKSLLRDMANPLISSMILDMGKWRELSALVMESTQEKDLLMYSRSAGVQKTLMERGLTGDFPKPLPGEDIFAVVVANLGGMKSDRYIQRDFTYRMDMVQDEKNIGTPLQYFGNYTLRFRHDGTYNAPLSHDYRGYVRIYVPKGSTLVQEEKGVNFFSEGEYEVIGLPVLVAVGEELVLNVRIRLPDTMVQNDQYTIHTFVQPGVQNTTQNILIHAPLDHMLVSKNTTVSTREHLAHITPTKQDPTSYTLTLLPDTTPPRITVQQFLDYNRLIIQFNEPVFVGDCENSEHYEIYDKDLHVPEITNRPVIRQIRCREREAVIYTGNIRTQYNEAFGVRVRNIRDMHNNVINPNPMDITIYQRFEKDRPEQN